MKVLFIDDEPLIRQGMQAIIPWEQYGFQDFYEAECGEDGLQLVHQYHPELILLDIRMSDMNGLEMAKILRDEQYDGRIIIVSGYADFEYAKKAIQYNVSAYLLKPVKTIELKAALEKVCRELEQRRYSAKLEEQPAEQMVEMALQELLTGKLIYSPQTAKAYQIDLQRQEGIRLVMIAAEDGEENLKFKETMKMLHKSVPYISYQQNQVVLFLRGMSEGQIYEKLRPQILQSGKYIFVIEGEPFHNLEEISGQYQELQKVSSKLFIYANREHVIRPQMALEEIDVSNYDLLTEIQSMVNHITTQDKEALLLQIGQFHSYLMKRCTLPNPVGFIVSNTYRQITNEFLKCYPQLSMDIVSPDDFFFELCMFHYLYEATDQLKKVLLELLEVVSGKIQDDPCEKLRLYMEMNYTSSIWLEQIAGELGYNSSYLGKLFKSKTGKSFNSYLDDIRIEHAKELLMKGVSVTQTAENVGIGDINYFTKKFKKIVGFSPSEYRKLNE